MTLTILENRFDLVFKGGVRAGERISLQQGPLTIGRTDANDICLPEHSVSRHHATLYELDGHWMLRDEQSSHGSFVNYRLMNSPTRLRHKDSLMFGTQEMEILDREIPVGDASPAIKRSSNIQAAQRGRRGLRYCGAVIALLCMCIAYLLVKPNQPVYSNVITSKEPQEMQRILMALKGGLTRGMTNQLPREIDIVLKWE